MPYTDEADLTERFGRDELTQLTDRGDPPAGAPDPAVLGQAIADAAALIEGHLRGRYRLPLASVPDLLRHWAGTIVRYLLYRNGAPEHVRDDYRDALRQLSEVATGRLKLPGAPGDVGEAAVEGEFRAQLSPRRFTHTSLKGF